MLIIALPKTASTSLLDTLSKIHGYEGNQVIVKENKRPVNYPILSSYHGDIREWNADQIASVKGGQFFKQHIPPTENNKNLLSEEKKVFLVRDPKEIIEAYYRADKNKIHEKREELIGIESLDEWLEKAKDIGLEGELNSFYEGWKNQDHTLTINYDELLKSPKGTVNKVESFWGLPLSSNVELSKKRYSRYSGSRTFINYLGRKGLQFLAEIKRKIS